MTALKGDSTRLTTQADYEAKNMGMTMTDVDRQTHDEPTVPILT